MVSLDVNSALAVIRPLLIFAFGMIVYSMFIFKFYRFVATRDIFDINLQQYNTYDNFAFLKKFFSVILYIIEYLLIFPIFVSFWFGVFTVLLLLLSHQNVEIVMLISMAIVTTIRACAYYDENLSQDVSKMLPFALLGVFLVDISFFDIAGFTEAFLAFPTLIETIIYYLLFTIVIEFFLRVLSLIFGFSSYEPVLEVDSD
jgi:hypothetical protein